ncbi:hypothetical protein Brms1b_005169 [Colletotrichum noveboracense]|nr:hypothetical protein Brms1b_005169 [Colletotrichum noveboracense]
MSTTKKLRVAVLGPKGQCGSCVVDELLSRGHSVVGLSRNPPREWQTSGDYKAESVDFNSINELSAALSRGYDAIAVPALCTTKTARLLQMNPISLMVLGMFLFSWIHVQREMVTELQV